MNLEFDKEMDALLRKAAKHAAAKSPVFDSHLDADEISMFAENALPDTARPAAISHFADCDQCRLILSNVITMNTAASVETVPVAAAVADVAAVEKSSWLAALFSPKGLALGFGSLALIFAGFLGFTAIQNLNSGNTELAQENTTAPAKAADTRVAGDLDESDSAADHSNSNSAAEPSEDMTSADLPEAQPGFGDGNSLTTGKDVAPQRQTAEEGFTGSRRDLGRLRDKKEDGRDVSADREEADADVMLSESRPAGPPSPAPPPVAAGSTVSKPTDDVITTRGVTASPKTANQPAKTKEFPDAAQERSDKSSASVTNVNGKTFNKRNGVWYDSAYKNQTTTNVTRGTTQYQKLDSGVRAIAGKLSGTIVVVWKSKAYRIH